MAKANPTAARLRRAMMRRDEQLIAHEQTIEELRSELAFAGAELGKSRGYAGSLERQLDVAQTLLSRWLYRFDQTEAAKLAADTRKALTAITNGCDEVRR